MFNRISLIRRVINIFNGENPNELKETVESNTVPNELLEIASKWYEKSHETGDIGCCVIGAGMLFIYKDSKYFMYPQSPWQGEGSWTKHVDWVKEELYNLGATEIYWDYGVVD